MDSLSATSELSVIGRWFARTHAYLFYVTRSTFKSVWDDGLQDWKALLVVSVAMLFAALACVATVSIALRHRVLLPNERQRFMVLWGTVALALTAINYYTLVFRRRWSRFEKEFQHLSKPARLLRAFVVWASMILIVAAAEWTALIAWKLPA
jgi:hypothetical protein